MTMIMTMMMAMRDAGEGGDNVDVGQASKANVQADGRTGERRWRCYREQHGVHRRAVNDAGHFAVVAHGPVSELEPALSHRIQQR